MNQINVRRLGASVSGTTLFLVLLTSPTAAGAVTTVDTGEGVQCTRLGPDTTVTVTGSWRIKNPDCDPGPWQTSAAPQRVELTDGDYVETRDPASSCTAEGVRAEVKPSGKAYCGPAWETRNDPIPGFN